MRMFLVLSLCLVALAGFTGCLGRFAGNQARRQAARSTDHYVRKYAEPELREAYRDDQGFEQEYRQGRNDLADTIVRTGNDRQKNRVGVSDRGWLTNEQ